MKHVTQSLVVCAALSAMLGCAPTPEGEVDPEPSAPDADGDGLSDDEEGDLGLDPSLADSDGDGFDDGVELDANSDPLDVSHFPYTGGWAIDPCNTSIEPSGNTVGSITDDFALMDQNGEMVRLHDFCGREVLLVTSAMWCEPCQDEAPELQHLYETYADQGLMVITLLGQNEDGASPSQSDLERWATTFDLEHPVLSDDNWEISARWVLSGYIPTMHLLGPGAVVLAGDTYVTETQVQQNLP